MRKMDNKYVMAGFIAWAVLTINVLVAYAVYIITGTTPYLLYAPMGILFMVSLSGLIVGLLTLTERDGES
jgi:hypothetical protein